MPYLNSRNVRNVVFLDTFALFDKSTNSSLYKNMFCFLFYRMRDTARKIEEKYFSNLATHVEFLPVEWRSKLTLDGGTLINCWFFCCSSSCSLQNCPQKFHAMFSAHGFFGFHHSPACNLSLFFFPDTVDSITPDKVRGLRDMLNSSAMDIMYYTSPLYRDEVSLVLCEFY